MTTPLDFPPNMCVVGIGKHKKDAQMKEQETLPDDLSPNYLFSGIDTHLLTQAVTGKLDLLYYAKQELANRGIDESGKWIGFSQAKKLHGVD